MNEDTLLQSLGQALRFLTDVYSLTPTPININSISERARIVVTPENRIFRPIFLGLFSFPL